MGKCVLFRTRLGNASFSPTFLNHEAKYKEFFVNALFFLSLDFTVRIAGPVQPKEWVAHLKPTGNQRPI